MVAAVLQSPVREKSADIVLNGLQTLILLADRNIANAALLGEAGACAGAVLNGLD